MAKTKEIFFATDIHGSESCFRKFVNASKVYDVDALILGGDITGKLLDSFVEEADGTFTGHYLESDHHLRTEEEVMKAEKMLQNSGHYSFRCTKKELEELNSDPVKVESLFKTLMIARLKSWIELAVERLKGTDIRLYLTGGNDDPLEVEAFLKNEARKTSFVADPEGEDIPLLGGYEMISCGYSNLTPWKCPRDISEEELGAKIEAMASKVKNMKRCIFNLHVPPYNSNLDLAPKLDEKLRPVIRSGGVEYSPVGSKAVRESIEKHNPLLSLHGHIHESKNFCKIGDTYCFNPGSEYGEGMLRGLLITLRDDSVKNFMPTYG